LTGYNDLEAARQDLNDWMASGLSSTTLVSRTLDARNSGDFTSVPTEEEMKEAVYNPAMLGPNVAATAGGLGLGGATNLGKSPVLLKGTGAGTGGRVVAGSALAADDAVRATTRAVDNVATSEWTSLGVVDDVMAAANDAFLYVQRELAATGTDDVVRMSAGDPRDSVRVVGHKGGMPVLNGLPSAERAAAVRASGGAGAPTGARYVPSAPVTMSRAHAMDTITATTRFGGGNKNAVKTIAQRGVNVQADLDEISAGLGVLNDAGDILTSSGRMYGRHTETGTVFLRSGSPGTVDLTQAEFGVLRQMVVDGGLQGNAHRMLDALLGAGNPGVSSQTAAKLRGLYGP
jgi:hypothetical protein